MNNREISHILSETARLMELHGVNEFKVKSVQNAAFNIGRLNVDLTQLPPEEIALLKGIGKSISQKILEILSSGTLAELDTLLSETPAGVVEMMRIKGIGPKKVAVLWKELGVESPGELLYACNENRLTELKGFGLKTQEQIKKAIEFSQSNLGLFHYAAADHVAENILEVLKQIQGVEKVSLTGQLRRKCEVLNSLEFIIATSDPNKVFTGINAHPGFANFLKEIRDNRILLTSEAVPPGIIYLVNPGEFAMQLLLTTGNDKHVDDLKQLRNGNWFQDEKFNEEKNIYQTLGLTYIEPELREGFDEIKLGLKDALPQLVEFSDLKGSLHNHSTYSDGANTLQEMATECKNLGYEYFGICDHSKSAFYANGLPVERILQQHIEIDKLNSVMAPFVIFKGIESDILPDGSLDYSDDILSKFDFVVASVHSVLKMTEQKATERLIKAISNPFTTILGHPTGRLLLAREGYPIDHKAVIDACAKYNVVIELNAHPYRLDLDWRWIRYAVEKGLMISINPDAHHTAGFHDMYFGVCAARKGMLPPANTFNALSRESVDAWFAAKRKSVQIRNETLVK